ncbi:MAG: hypothetical protein AAGF67_00305 [Verrucomicrobiota bacterium]
MSSSHCDATSNSRVLRNDSGQNRGILQLEKIFQVFDVGDQCGSIEKKDFAGVTPSHDFSRKALVLEQTLITFNGSCVPNDEGVSFEKPESSKNISILFLLLALDYTKREKTEFIIFFRAQRMELAAPHFEFAVLLFNPRELSYVVLGERYMENTVSNFPNAFEFPL